MQSLDMGIIVLHAPRMPWAGTKRSAPQEGLALTPCSPGDRAQQDLPLLPGPSLHPPSLPAAEGCCWPWQQASANTVKSEVTDKAIYGDSLASDHFPQGSRCPSAPCLLVHQGGL